jgi:hypothetical protein
MRPGLVAAPGDNQVVLYVFASGFQPRTFFITLFSLSLISLQSFAYRLSSSACKNGTNIALALCFSSNTFRRCLFPCPI